MKNLFLSLCGVTVLSFILKVQSHFGFLHTLVEDFTLFTCNFWVWPCMSAVWLCCSARPRYGQRLLPWQFTAAESHLLSWQLPSAGKPGVKNQNLLSVSSPRVASSTLRALLSLHLHRCVLYRCSPRARRGMWHQQGVRGDLVQGRAAASLSKDSGSLGRMQTADWEHQVPSCALQMSGISLNDRKCQTLSHLSKFLC